MYCLAVAMLIAIAGFAAPVAAEAAQPAYNDGTDPARPARTATLSYEHRTLANEDQQRSLFAYLNLPLRGNRTVLAVRAPLVSLDSAGNGFGLGDVGVTLSQVLPTGSSGAVILGTQLEFNSASRPERGAGQTVATASMIFEHVSRRGAILAPSIVHSLGISGNQDRINLTRLNLYIVPAVSSDRLYLTVDPALTLDWGEGRDYAEVAFTVGYLLGQLMGGDVQIFARPSAGIGEARSSDWAFEIGFQLLNF